jgi:hypothetical protein
MPDRIQNRLCDGLMIIGMAVSIFVCTSCTRHAEFNRIKRTVDAQKLQNWAVEILQQQAVGNRPLVGAETNGSLPAVVKSIPASGLIGPMIGVYEAKEGQPPHIELLYFDSWGHGFCICVGGPEYLQETNSWRFELAPGVYYENRSHGVAQEAERRDRSPRPPSR